MTIPAFRRRAGALCATILATALGAGALAQSPPPSFEVPRRYDTGWVVNQQARTESIASFPMRVPGASWMRLSFEEISLPEKGARLRITSVLDGGQQELDARQCLQWRAGSAYFNGDDLQVEIVAEPGSGRCRVVVAGITAGIPPMPSFSQCGTTDDRVPSFDRRAGRAMPIGCTAWMIDDCSHNFLTAGHCSTVTLQIVEFNVPLSGSSGSVNHPGPEDQYTVDASSRQSLNGGSGNDWGYFGVFPNPITGLRPFQKQQATYQLANSAPQPNGTLQIRVTGYGTDTTPAQNNQIQQTATGPYVQHSGTSITYRTDTEGGNSGSPVIWEGQDIAIGIHTHGGCTQAGGANIGTAIEHPDLRAAISSPLGQCGCRGEWSTYCVGKLNSQGCVEEIGASGMPSVSGGPGSFEINGSQILNQKVGILFYGFAPASTPFQGGIACIGGPLRRTPALTSGGTSGPPDCSGTFTFDMGARIASGVDFQLVMGANVFAQFYSRDPASPTGPYGLTNGLQFTIGP